jgi:hypothetical protein
MHYRNGHDVTININGVKPTSLVAIIAGTVLLVLKGCGDQPTTAQPQAVTKQETHFYVNDERVPIRENR